MRASITRRINLFGCWSGIVYVAMLFGGWFVVGGFFPPHRPTASAQDVATFFQGHPNLIRFGMVIVMWGAAMFIPFTATASDYFSRVEGRNGPLTRIMMLSGYGNVMLSFYPPLWWIAASWRADERAVDITRTLNDVAWLQFIGGLSLIMPWFVIGAIAAFADENPDPLLPRWFGWLSIMCFAGSLPDQALFFFKTGPFAWNGVLGFWIPASVFGIWIITLAFLLRRAVLREAPPISDDQLASA